MASASEWDASEEQLELRVRQFAIPVALAVAFLLVKTGIGHFMLRTFCSMWVHELGHAVAAWLCGYPAFPGPWLTLTAESRSPLLALLLFAALAGCGDDSLPPLPTPPPTPLPTPVPKTNRTTASLPRSHCLRRHWPTG